MQESRQTYAVTVEARLPEFETERLFVINEKKYAHQELEKLEDRPMILKAALPVLGGPKPKDWRQYIKALDHYWGKLHEHMEEIADGLVPLKFYVVNNGEELDESIKIRVRIENGSIHPAKEPPKRPARVDNGPEHVTNWTPVSPLQPLAGGFSRRGIKVTPHKIEAVFSELEGHDSADLVHQILYIEADESTRFFYEISSKRLGIKESGEVGFI